MLGLLCYLTPDKAARVRNWCWIGLCGESGAGRAVLGWGSREPGNGSKGRGSGYPGERHPGLSMCYREFCNNKTYIV